MPLADGLLVLLMGLLLLLHLTNDVLAIDEGLKATDLGGRESVVRAWVWPTPPLTCSHVIQWEDIFGFYGVSTFVFVSLEYNHLGRREVCT